MNSINVNGCSVCQPKIKIMRHKFIRHCLGGNGYWYAMVVNGKIKYNIEIEENIIWNGKYYMGYLYNDDIRKKYSNTYIVFGFSNYHNTYRYILDAILRVIKGDYNEIKGAGFCIARPNE